MEVNGLLIAGVMVLGTPQAPALDSNVVPPLIAQAASAARPQPRSSAPTQDRKWSADLTLALHTSDNLRWWEVQPSFTYRLDDRWSVDLGAPTYFVSGDLSEDGLSHAGIGDLYGGLAVDLSNDMVTASSTLWGSIATGDASKGLGAGQAIWEWTNHLAINRGPFSPYVDLGFSNALDYGTRVSVNGASGLRGAGQATNGNLFNGEAGVELSLSEAFSVSAGAYITRPLGSQTTGRRVPLRRPGGPGGPPLPVTTTASAVSERDSGMSATLSGTLSDSVDASVLFWRSTTFRYNMLSVSLTVRLADLFKIR